jgi:hypothetical protein
MTAKELQHMPKALRILAEQIQAPDHVPAMCLRDAAAMIESLELAIRTTIEQNLHLADGDICTLKALKDAIGYDN